MKKENGFIKFLLILITIVLAGIVILFGYVMYNEFAGNGDFSFDNLELIYPKIENQESNNKIDNAKPTSSTKLDVSLNQTQETNNNDYSNNYLYKQLNTDEKIIYQKLYENKENLKTGTFRIDFGNQFQTLLSQSNGEKELKQKYQSAIEVLIYENPEIFYLDATKMFINIEKTTKLTSTKYNVYIDSGNKVNYLADGLSGKEDIDTYQLKIEKVRDYIVSKVNGKSDYEKIKMIHDYLRDTIEYDSTLSKSNIYDIYGALVLRECVCEGYAKSFQYLMNEVEIDNVIVIGTGTNSTGKTENHAWNYVLLDNNWYAIDVTWDDPILIGEGKMPEESKYKYFLKGANTMNQNHVPSGKFTDAGQTFQYPMLSVEDYK